MAVCLCISGAWITIIGETSLSLAKGGIVILEWLIETGCFYQ